MRQETLDLVSDLSARFDEERFVFVPGEQLLAIDELDAHFIEFARTWKRLPPDRYFMGSKPQRFRRHAQLDLDADSGGLSWRPATGYYQRRKYNPLFGGFTRYFAPIERTTATEAVLSALIRLASGSIFKLAGTWLVNVHLIRTVSEPGSPTAPAPEGPHRDGYDAISLHLVDRNNDIGGATMLLDESDDLLHSFTLGSPMDTLYIDDTCFRHDVTSIAAAGRSCHRDMILMSYEQTDGLERSAGFVLNS